MGTPCVLAMDQGTTSSRAVVFGADFAVLGQAQREFPQHFPQPGWVEHDPEDIWSTTEQTAKEALAQAGVNAADVAAAGIANQRETTLLWERDTGQPVHRAIVWQDRRTADMCEKLRAEGREEIASAKSGLLLDPYFSASKIAWLLERDDALRAAARRGEILFGTVDSFLMWRLSGGKIHRTDATNASRTLLFDIRQGRWDEELLDMFGVPKVMLPEVCDSAADFAETSLFGGRIKIAGVAGDQQAAAAGQACFSPGMLKSTYGTGCFALLNTGDSAPRSKNRLLTTVACQLEGKRTYALEGSIFVAGAAIQWLRDGLQILDDAAQSGTLAADADDGQEVIMVPAFAGLGAPYWDAEARGALFGLTRAASRKEIARAALEAACFQTRDLLEAMRADCPEAAEAGGVLRVDGGMSASDWTMQRLADIVGGPVERPQVLETTSLGAAYLAGMRAGVYPDPKEFAKTWRRDRRFDPAMQAPVREKKYAAWRDAVRRTLSSLSST